MLKARPMSIVKFDIENEEPLRGSDGFFVECGHDEPGELIAPIRKIQTASGEVDDFEGYTNKEATEKKVARDVFKKGDSYFRTGDLIRRDSKGYFYFVDRIGDTFRWKGENVSTWRYPRSCRPSQALLTPTSMESRCLARTAGRVWWL